MPMPSEEELRLRERSNMAGADKINAYLSMSSVAGAAEAADLRSRQQAADRLLSRKNRREDAELSATLGMKYGGPFSGTSMDAQSLNAMWKIAEAKGMSRDQFMAEVSRQRLERPTTITTPEGTHTRPGIDMGFLGGGGSQPAPGGGSTNGVPDFTPKKKTEGEKKGEYTVGLMNTIHNNAEDYTPGFWESLASDRADPAVAPYLESDEYKQSKINSEEWAAALVFLQSGATARQEEVDRKVRNYWPQRGDSAARVAEKKEMRARDMAAAERAYTEREGGGGGVIDFNDLP